MLENIICIAVLVILCTVGGIKGWKKGQPFVDQYIEQNLKNQ